MGLNLTSKIIKEHLVKGNMVKGEVVELLIDQTLTQDATGTMCYLQFEAMGLDKVKNELAISYVDHNTVQVGFENADDHKYLQSVAAKKGVIFSRPGNGICHQVHLERFGVCGKTLLGSDSHTPTGGGLGMMAMGAGGLDVALAMAGFPFSIIYPKVIEIRLTGALSGFASAKDIILEVLKHFSVKGNVNTVFEYTGPGVNSLSVPQRATICNMGAECGVTTSIFPTDEKTREFLKAHNREKDYRECVADPDASYDGLLEIDLTKIVPLAACPHSPGNIQTIENLEGMKVDQVLIGSCTNSSYQDMQRVGQILDGKTINSNVSLGVAPGSREVLMMITKDGTLGKMIAAGARILESACGFCIGNHFSPSSNGISLRTSNRNFEARSGTKSGQVYLVSPETAALAALYGKVVNPNDIKADFKNIDITDFILDDSLLIFPPADSSDIEIVRGPNIGDPPVNEALADEFTGFATIKVGDKITTDHIMPAGARLKYRSNIPLYSTFVFEPVDNTFPPRCLENKEKKIANFIVAGYSYGQGSSREHAALCPMYLGVKAVLALSIERIHQANLCNAGILPLIFASEDDYNSISQDDEIEILDLHNQLKNDFIMVTNKSKNIEYKMNLELTDSQKSMIVAGGRLNQVKEMLNG